MKHFVGELSGMFLFNSTCAPEALMIFLMVSPPTKINKEISIIYILTTICCFNRYCI